MDRKWTGQILRLTQTIVYFPPRETRLLTHIFRFAFLNPTQAHYTHTNLPEKSSSSQKDSDNDSEGGPYETTKKSASTDTPQAASNVFFKWTSRNNRKGRHAIVIKPTSEASPGAKYETPLPSTSLRTISRNILRMFTYYPVWDVSWNVAYIFTWGSILWVINGFFSLLPLTNPSSEFPNEVLTGGGITAFIGATIFEFGSVLLMLEAINENRSGCFGWAVEKAFDHGGEKGSVLRIRPDEKRCTHHHKNKKNFVGKPNASATDVAPSADIDGGRSWVWYPSKHDLMTHYIYDLGFLACSAQMVGATIFWIAGFTSLPGINNKLSQGLLDGIYWTPQVVGAIGFVTSGLLFMIETQKKWWLPAFDVLGWHIGAWNFIGAMGFLLCGCFGYDPASWSAFQASTSTFWGSWAFLIGSVLQLYESLEKQPVEVDNSMKADKST